MIDRKSANFIPNLDEKLFGLDHPFRVAEYKQQNGKDPFAAKNMAEYLEKLFSALAEIALASLVAALMFWIWSKCLPANVMLISALFFGVGATSSGIALYILLESRLRRNQYLDFAARIGYVVWWCFGSTNTGHYIKLDISEFKTAAKGAITSLAKQVIESHSAPDHTKTMGEVFDQFKYYYLLAADDDYSEYFALAKEQLKNKVPVPGKDFH